MSRGPVDPQTLLSMALSQPAEALRLARQVLAEAPDPVLATAAHQAAGVVLRHFGAIDESVRELRLALRWARRTGDDDRSADVAASLGVALAMAGRRDSAVQILDGAVAATRGITRGRVLIRRANVHWMGADYHRALDDARRAVRLLASDEEVWRARAVNHRAMMHLALGDARRADRDYERSEVLFAAADQQFELGYARMERGLAAHALGDLPRALQLLEQTEVLFAAQGVVEPDLAAAKAAVLISAGLSREALRVADAALTHLQTTGGAATNRATLLDLAGQAAIAAGDPATATERGGRALVLYRRQGNQLGADRARLAILGARVESGAAGPPLGPADLRRAISVAGRLATREPELAARCHLLAANIATRLGRTDRARTQLARAAVVAGRTTGGRSVAWLARARLHSCDGEAAATLRAAAAGLRVIEAQLRTLGALELRSATTAQGADLAAIGLRTALDLHRPDLVLGWAERWRSVALAVPPVRPDDDAQLSADLTALRMITRRLAGDDSPRLQRERRRLEGAVRARVRALGAGHRGPGGSGEQDQAQAPAHTARAGEIRAAVADSGGRLELVELFTMDDDLHAAHVQGTRIRLHRIGFHADATRATEQALFLLRREGAQRGAVRMDLNAVGVRLQRALLGELADLIESPQVVVVPPGRLHAVPWALLPALRDRSVAVAPSATSWLRARAAPAAERRRVVLVSGPGLPGGAEEVAALAARYPDAVTLTDQAATTQATLTQMDGASLVHLAAHGTFRADSPLFSTIELADGPLTGYDLERLTAAPHRMLLSSCSSAVGAPTGADELLGVVSSLIARGCTGVVASVVPVSDPGTVPLMLAVHEYLDAGLDLPAALHAAVRATVNGSTVNGVTVDGADATGSRVSRAAAGSFIALGA